MPFPDRVETLDRLVALDQGRLLPEEAAEWARSHVTNEGLHPTNMDWPVWDALNLLVGADLQAAPGEYLHGPEDYAAWLTGFRQAAQPRPR